MNQIEVEGMKSDDDSMEGDNDIDNNNLMSPASLSLRKSIKGSKTSPYS